MKGASLHFRFLMQRFLQLLLFAGLIHCGLESTGHGAASPTLYTLVEGSYLLKDCPICGGPRPPAIFQPLRGTFELSILSETPTLRHCALTHVNLSTRTDPIYNVTGTGTLDIDPSKNEQALILNLQINGEDKVFTNDLNAIDWAWPMIDAHVVQTQANLTQFYSLQISAAPFRDLWFSTRTNFTPTNASLVTSGDLLSFSGRVVKSSTTLLGRLGFMPGVAPADLDAVSVMPGAEVWFSMGEDRFSETLGQIRQGDLLSDQGRIVETNARLMTNFAPQPFLDDYGLDALHVMNDGEILFSISTNVSSPQAGALFSGDILSFRTNGVATTNRLFLSNSNLLSRFHPVNPEPNYGLDALFLWPNGEIWFSTETGFDDEQLGPVSEGDLLSDQGRIIYHNLELLSAFVPKETNANFGLDALYMITDLTASASRPVITSAFVQQGLFRMDWTASGRAFQVERASAVTGPYLPASPILLQLTFADTNAISAGTSGFYRLRQW